MVEPLPLQRTHLRINDSEWLPGSRSGARWAVSGAVGGAASSLLLAFAVEPLLGITLPYLAMAGAGTLYAVGRMTRRARLRLVTSGAVPLASLPDRVGGHLAYARGRVRAQRRIPGLLDGDEVVYRRLVFFVDGAEWVHEAAVPFILDLGRGEEIGIDVAGARLLGTDPALSPQTSETGRRLLALLPEPKEWFIAARRELLALSVIETRAGEVTIRDGDEVEVLGYKDRVVDPTVASRLERETPMRTTMRTGDLPLILAPAAAPLPPVR